MTWFAILLAAATAGCGSNNPRGRLAVSGRVTLDGTALDRGTIIFNTQAPNGVSSGAVIQRGAYSIPELKGLPPGKYLVRINSAALPQNTQSGSGEVAAPGAPLAMGAERIAPRYNADSAIVVEVVAGRKASFDFDVKSK